MLPVAATWLMHAQDHDRLKISVLFPGVGGEKRQLHTSRKKKKKGGGKKKAPGEI